MVSVAESKRLYEHFPLINESLRSSICQICRNPVRDMDAHLASGHGVDKEERNGYRGDH